MAIANSIECSNKILYFFATVPMADVGEVTEEEQRIEKQTYELYSDDGT